MPGESAQTKQLVLNGVVFVIVFALFVLSDRLSKIYFETALSLGQSSESAFPWLFNFTLVHNTGAAWGMFNNSTLALGILSTVVCVAIMVFAAFLLKEGRWYIIASLAMIAAGGLGNAIDRFVQGFVTDFINLSFIDFPVFNIADIGVTCGTILFLFLYLISTRENSAKTKVKLESSACSPSTTDTHE